MKWLLLGLAALGLVACADRDEPQPSPSPTLPSATLSVTPETSPASQTSPTAVPGCQPLLPDGGFPVMLGSLDGNACVLWRGPSPARVVVEEGAFASDAPPAKVTTFDGVSSPFSFPAGVLPGVMPGRPCFDRDGGFRVRVESRGGMLIGGEERHTCSSIVILADGCEVGAPGNDPVGLGRIASAGPGEPAVCIVWPDRLSNETGFRVELSYPGSGEKFTYFAPANTVEFVPPAADTSGVGTFTGLGRKDWSISVFALTPEGEKYVGGQAVTVM